MPSGCKTPRRYGCCWRACLFFAKHANRFDVLLVAFGVVGVGLILFYELRSGDRLGIVLGVLSGLTYSGVILSLRNLREFDSAWLVALNHLAVVIVLGPYLLATAPGWPSGAQWPYLAGFGILQMGVPYLLFARGMKAIPGHEAAGIALLEPLLLPVWVFLAWGHTATYTPPKWWTIAGGSLILCGLAVKFVGEAFVKQRERRKDRELKLMVDCHTLATRVTERTDRDERY